MSTHNIAFYGAMTKIKFQLSSNTHLNCCSASNTLTVWHPSLLVPVAAQETDHHDGNLALVLLLLEGVTVLAIYVHCGLIVMISGARESMD